MTLTEVYQVKLEKKILSFLSTSNDTVIVCFQDEALLFSLPNKKFTNKILTDQNLNKSFLLSRKEESFYLIDTLPQ